MNTTPDLVELADPARFAQRYLEAFGVPPRERVAYGFAAPSVLACARMDTSGQAWADADSTFVAPGCLTKLLTSVLVMRSLAAGEVDLDDEAAVLLGERLGAPVVLRHLLEHTHGLDGSAFARAPLAPDGCIDVAPLCAGLRARRALARPGRLYSYGDVGAWLAAAVLERRSARNFESLLSDAIGPRHVAGVPASEPDAASICPSRGGALRIRLGAFVAFLRDAALEVAGRALRRAAEGAGSMTPLPGFSLLERGIRLGWKYYGDGWFGHSTNRPGAEALVRLHAASRRVLVVAAGNPPALVVAARLLGPHLPELAGLRMPKPLGAEEAGRLDAMPYSGTYATAAETLTIRPDEGGGLALTRAPARGGQRDRLAQTRARLAPAGNDVFLTRPALAALPFVQCLGPGVDGFEHVWNGRQLWRRLDRG